MAVLSKPDPFSQADFHEAITSSSDRWFSACLKITRNPDLVAVAVQDTLLSASNTATSLTIWLGSTPGFTVLRATPRCRF